MRIERRKGRVHGMLVLLAAAGAVGCSGGDADDVPATGEDEVGAPAAGTTEPTRHLGLFFAGDVLEFESCDGAVHAVDGPATVDLVSMHQRLVPGVEPLEAVFVDILGRVVDGPGGTTLDAIELRRVTYEGNGCDRDDEGLFFVGRGVEPFWLVEIGEDGFVWETPSGRDSYTHSGLYDGPQGAWMFDALGPGDRPGLTVRILQTPCTDAMSGAWFHLTMEVERGAERFEGCAWLAPGAETGIVE